MCDEFYQNLDNGKLNGVFFPDIRKAFDSVDHKILLCKMKTQFGLRNVELDWFASYLANREQVCDINGSIYLISENNQNWSSAGFYSWTTSFLTLYK